MIETNPSEYFSDLERRIAEAFVMHEEEEVRRAPGVIASVWLGRMRDRTRWCVQVTERALYREGFEDFRRSEKTDRLWEVFIGRPFVRMTVKRAKRAVKALRIAIQSISSAGVRVDQAVEPLVREEGRWRRWLANLKRTGTEASRKNLYYMKALNDVMTMLKAAGMTYVPYEAVRLLWHAGFRDLCSEVTVLDPFSTAGYRSGKDPRDEMRRRVAARLKDWKWQHTLALRITDEEAESELLHLARKLRNDEPMK